MAQPPSHEVGSDDAHEQRGQHLGDVAPEAKHAGNARPQGAADDAAGEGDEQREGTGATDAHAHVPGERRTDHQLSLLPDVHQAGPSADGRAKGDEEDGGRDTEGQTPSPGVADGAVEDDRVNA